MQLMAMVVLQCGFHINKQFSYMCFTIGWNNEVLG
ncbi:MAG: hypothetical protein ACD_62C00212G0001, partial [uncultured bacterium]